MSTTTFAVKEEDVEVNIDEEEATAGDCPMNISESSSIEAALPISSDDVKDEIVEVIIDENLGVKEEEEEEEVIAGDRPLKNGADTSTSDLSSGAIEVELLQEQDGEADVRDVSCRCTKCGKMFLNATRLQEHHRRFHAKRPYTCPQCLQGFFTKENLKAHLDNHGVMPYRCSRCDKSFWKQGYLRTHERIHLFHCKQCERSFTKIGYLFRHQKTHTADEPYLR